MQIGFGKPFITTEEFGSYSSGKDLQYLIENIVERQEKYIENIMNTEGIKALPTTNRDFPKTINKIVDNKIAYIEGLMGASARAIQQTNIYKDIAYQVSARGTITFGEAWMNAGTIGDFVQDISVFGGITGMVPVGNLPLPDILGIETELKESFAPKTIHTGQVTLGIEFQGAGTTEQEKYAEGILRNVSVKKYTAMLELYMKMKNLLLVISDIPAHPTLGGAQRTRVHFLAITLFVELILKEVEKWVDEGLKKYLTSTGYRGSLSGQRGITYTGPYVKISQSALKKNKTKTSINYTQTYEMSFESLFSGENTKKGINDLLKNLERIYLMRRDLLKFMSGIGQGKEARNFFGRIKNLEMPAFNFSNINISY
jgi:hypothetical protein